jgi:hypothetical protein
VSSRRRRSGKVVVVHLLCERGEKWAPSKKEKDGFDSGDWYFSAKTAPTFVNYGDTPLPVTRFSRLAMRGAWRKPTQRPAGAGVEQVARAA